MNIQKSRGRGGRIGIATVIDIIILSPTVFSRSKETCPNILALDVFCASSDGGGQVPPDQRSAPAADARTAQSALLSSDAVLNNPVVFGADPLHHAFIGSQESCALPVPTTLISMPPQSLNVPPLTSLDDQSVNFPIAAVPSYQPTF